MSENIEPYMCDTFADYRRLRTSAAAFSQGVSNHVIYTTASGTAILTRDTSRSPIGGAVNIFVSHTCGACIPLNTGDNVPLKLLSGGFSLSAIQQIKELLTTLSPKTRGL